jgi:DNA-binding response OmpR family regulator
MTEPTEPTAPAAERLVLLVEDDEAVRRPLEKFLRIHHFGVVTADDAEGAIEAAALHNPAAAIVDLRLRQGSGREVVDSLPERVPVIIFSAVPDESNALEATRPLTRLVVKPYSLVMLVETLEEMLAEARARADG